MTVKIIWIREEYLKPYACVYIIWIRYGFLKPYDCIQIGIR